MHLLDLEKVFLFSMVIVIVIQSHHFSSDIWFLVIWYKWLFRQHIAIAIVTLNFYSTIFFF